MIVDVETNLVQDYWSWQAGLAASSFTTLMWRYLYERRTRHPIFSLVVACHITVCVQEISQLLQHRQGVNQRWDIHFLAKHF